MASAYGLWSVLSFTSFFLCDLSLSDTVITLEEFVEARQSLISFSYLPEILWLKLKQRIWESIRGSGRNVLAHLSLLFFSALKPKQVGVLVLCGVLVLWGFFYSLVFFFFFFNSTNPEQRNSKKQKPVCHLGPDVHVSFKAFNTLLANVC